MFSFWEVSVTIWRFKDLRNLKLKYRTPFMKTNIYNITKNSI